MYSNRKITKAASSELYEANNNCLHLSYTSIRVHVNVSLAGTAHLCNSEVMDLLSLRNSRAEDIGRIFQKEGDAISLPYIIQRKCT